MAAALAAAKADIEKWLHNDEAERHAFQLHNLTILSAVFGVIGLLWVLWKMSRAGPRTKWLPEDHPEAVRAAAQGRILARRVEPVSNARPATAVVDNKSRATVELLADDDVDGTAGGDDEDVPPPLPPRPSRSKKD